MGYWDDLPEPMDPFSDEYISLMDDTSLSGKRIRCQECGKRHTLRWNGAANKEFYDSKLCSDCHFWATKINWDPENVVRVDHRHYHIGEEVTGPGFVGHGGRVFRIYFFDGRVVETRNLWSQGEIPERFWDRMPDNARFITEDEQKVMLAPSIPEVPATGLESLKDYLKSNHEGAKFIDWTQPIQVLSSGGGYYIGMLDADGGPMCRFSAEYWQTAEEAQSALDNMSFSLKLWL